MHTVRVATPHSARTKRLHAALYVFFTAACFAPLAVSAESQQWVRIPLGVCWLVCFIGYFWSRDRDRREYYRSLARSTVELAKGADRPGQRVSRA